MANPNEQGQAEPLDETRTFTQPVKPSVPAPGGSSTQTPANRLAPEQLAPHELTQTSSGVPSSPVERRVPRAGEFIGGDDGRRFQLIEQIGAGAMGVVFLANDQFLDRTVAIKFITPGIRRAADSTPTDMVKSEARAMARLSHENIVRIFDVGVHADMPFQVMEYLEGRTLSSAISYEEFDTRRATSLMIDIARGLAHAHKSGVIHRDLKPSNIFLVREGRAKILDLGLAQMAAGLERDAQTPAIAGTPLYMSPEQWRGAPQDGRTDIWSAGVIFFQLLTGQVPFPGQGSEAIRARVLGEAPAPLLRTLRPDLPAEAERIVERALQKEPGRRFGSTEELLDALVGLEVALSHSLRTAWNAPHQAQRTVRARPERRQMTLLSCALADVTPLSERLGADEYGELLASFFESCATIIGQLEGTLIASVGGRVLACFGYPLAHEDDAQRALRAALLLRDSIAGLGGASAPHAVQIGIHTGKAFAGKPSGAEASAFIQGEVPHVAQWLEQKAGRGEILISEATQGLIQGFFEVEGVGAEAPGTRPLELFRVLRPREVSSRFVRTTAGLTPLVGRESEAGQLRALWELASQGQGQMLLVSGEAGIGKSRLVELLKERVADASGHRVSCQCWSQFRNSALYPLVDGLQRLMEMGPDMAAPDKLARLEGTLTSLGLAPAEHLPLLASFLSIPLSGSYTLPTLSPDAYKRNLLESLAAVLLGLAAQKPTLLILEDVHWSDGLTLELLDLVFQRMTSARLLAVLSFRPEFQPPWAERAHLRRISLQRLSSAETAVMVSLSTNGQTLPAELIEHLVRRTDGIPLFVEELARIVTDSWREALAQGESTTVEAFAARVIPSTINELLLARLDCLSDEGQEVAQLGAVLGREFTYKLIQRVSPLDEERLRQGLMQVVESGLLRHQGREPDASYVFKHALVQDAAYQSLSKSERQQHHLRVAEALVGHFPAQAEAQPELVAHHHLEAGNNTQAIAWLEKAGQRAAQRSAHADAVTHYARALLLLKTLPEGPQRDRKELALQLAYGAPLMSTRGYAAPEVHQTYARARELCREAGDDAQMFPAVLGLWQFYMVGGEVEVSAELGRQLLAQAESAGDATTLMLAHRALGTSLMLSGELVSCREHTEKGLLLYDREKHGKLVLRYGQDPGVTNGLYLGWSLWFLGHADESVRRAQGALSLARALEQPLSIAFALNYLATIHNYRGEYSTALQLAEEATTISSEHRLALWSAMSKIQKGWSLMGMGQLEQGELLKEGVTGWQKTGAAAGLTFFLSALIWSLWQAGRLDEALKNIEQMEALVKAKGERFFEAELLRLRGEVTLASGAGQERVAEDCFRRGLEVARRQQAKSWELRLGTSLANLLEKQGRGGEARQLLQPLYDWFTEGRETADLRTARAVLARLG